jgi:hypothetical protein
MYYNGDEMPQNLSFAGLSNFMRREYINIDTSN